MFKETYEYEELYYNNMVKITYCYEVEFIALRDFRGKSSIVNNSEFKKFVESEFVSALKKNYDMDINIRDLYPLEIHTQNKREEDVNRLSIINDTILNINSRISRRVTKKEIVYKKDKSRSIISVQISKRNYLKIFFLTSINEYDCMKKCHTISKKNCRTLEKLLYIKDDNDLYYFKSVINKYIKEVFKK